MSNRYVISFRFFDEKNNFVFVFALRPVLVLIVIKKNQVFYFLD